MNKTKKIIFTSFFAALCCVLTMIIKVPSPIGGYVNLGDAAVLASGWFLGGWYGFLASAIGSALADVFSGFVVYAPATFIIKGLMAVIFFTFAKNDKKLSLVSGALISELFMCAGYYVFEGFLYGFGPSFLNVPPNMIQGAISIFAGLLLIEIFKKSKISL